MEQKRHASVCIYKVFRTLFIFACVFLVMFTSVSSLTAHAEDPDDSYDLEAVANSLGTIMSIGSTPTKEGIMGVTPLIGIVNTGDNNSRCGNAGLTLAFTSRPTSIGQWIASKISNSSMSYDYGSLLRLSDGADTITPCVYHYAVYGHALKQLGLDNVSYGPSIKGMLFRGFVGYTTLVSYLFASAVNGLFSFAIHALQFLNPFGWLANVAKDYNAAAGAQYSAVQTGSGSMAKLIHYIAGIYATCCNLSWGFVIPMMIAFYLAGMFLFKKISGGGRMIKRILFITIGVPLVGGTYTSFLANIGEFCSGASYADQLIASTFVDFESWAVSMHLSPPTDKGNVISVKVPIDSSNKKVNSPLFLGGNVTNDTLYNISDICLEINKESNGLDDISTETLRDGYTFDEKTLDDATFSMSVADGAKSELDDGSTMSDDASDSMMLDKDASEIVETVDNDESDTKKWVMDLLLRYASGSTYTAEQFASAIQSRMTDLSVDDGKLTTEAGGASGESAPDNSGKAAVIIDKMMHATSCYTNFETYASGDGSLLGTLSSIFSSRPTDDSYKLGTDGTKTDRSVGECIAARDYTGFGNYNIFNDGSLFCTQKANPNGKGMILEYRVSKNESRTPYVRNQNGQWYDKDAESNPGLSTMSMYNYLNSDFNDTGVVVFGGGNAISNGLIKKNHYSVNIVGGSILGLFLWISAIMMLTCMTWIGVSYSLGMFFGTFKYTIKAVTSMPLAVLGSLRHIAKFIGTVAAMIMNVLVTVFMYGVCVEVLFVIRDIASSNLFLMSLVSHMGIIGAMLLGSIVGTIFILIITIILSRIRKQTVSSITEWITQVIGKFFESDAHQDPSKPKSGIAGKVASGVASGAGMMMMGAGALKSASAMGEAMNALSGGSGNNGPKDPDGGGKDGGGNNDGGGGSRIEKEDSDHNSNDKTTAIASSSEKGSSDHNKLEDKSSDHNSNENDTESNNNQLEATADHDAEISKSDSHSDESHTVAVDKDGKEESGNGRGSNQSGDQNSQGDQKQKAIKAAEQADTSGTAYVAAENVKDAKTMKDSASKVAKDLKNGNIDQARKDAGSGAKAAAHMAATDAATAFGGTKAGETAGKATDAVTNGSNPVKSVTPLGGSGNGQPDKPQDVSGGKNKSLGSSNDAAPKSVNKLTSEGTVHGNQSGQTGIWGGTKGSSKSGNRVRGARATGSTPNNASTGSNGNSGQTGIWGGTRTPRQNSNAGNGSSRNAAPQATSSAPTQNAPRPAAQSQPTQSFETNTSSTTKSLNIEMPSEIHVDNPD